MLNDKISVLTLNTDMPWVRELLNGSLAGLLIKFGLIIGLIMYSLFALVIIKQVGIMAETYEAEANGVVKLFAWAHLIMAIMLLGAGILLL